MSISRVAVVCLGASCLAAQEISLTQLSTSFNTPIGVDYHEPTDSLILSVNYSGGLPHNLERIEFDGSNVPYSGLAGLTDELKIATVRSIGNPGGFTVGDVFTGNGNDGEIVRVTDDGATVINPWVSLPGAGNGLMRGSLYVDRTGVFDGDLIVCTTAGEVWRVDSSGEPSLMVDLNVHLEGLLTVPDDPDKYGPWAGTILAGAEAQGLLWSITREGSATSYNLGIAPEDLDIIRPGEGFFGVNFGSSRLLAAPPSTFAGMEGDILITEEFFASTGLYHVRWDGTDFAVTEFALAPGSEVPAQWEHVSFAPIGIVPFPTCSIDAAGTIAAGVGIPLSFAITGADVDTSDIVTLSALEIPTGATTTPVLPAQGNPVVVTFDWTPGVDDIGTHDVVFVATDSSGLETVCSVTIGVAECFLLLTHDPTLGLVGGEDPILTSQPVTFPVAMGLVPQLAIPASVELHGVRLYSQVVMNNPLAFPDDPMQVSNVIEITLGRGWSSHEVGTGIDHWLESEPVLGGMLSPAFKINGW